MAKLEGILEINEILNDYCDDIQNGISKIAQEVAKEDVNNLRNQNLAEAPQYQVRSGEYNRGWTIKTTRGMNHISCIVHNKDHYQLTHLLEKGHNLIGRDGTSKGRTRAFPHIAPVEKKSNEIFKRKVEDLIRNGG